MKNVYKRYHLIMEVCCLILCVLPLAYLFLHWHQLPTELPMHYDASGNVTRYGSKFEVLPLVFLYIGMYFLLTLVALCPYSWNLPVKVTEKKPRPGVGASPYHDFVAQAAHHQCVWIYHPVYDGIFFHEPSVFTPYGCSWFAHCGGALSDDAQV